MAAVVHHDAVAAESVRNGERNSGSGVTQSPSTVSQTHRRIRKAIIESDPEDDEDMPITGAVQSSTHNHTNSTVKDGPNQAVHTSVRNGSRINSGMSHGSQTMSTSSGNLPATESNLPSTSGGHTAAMYTMDTDISQLEAPTFTTLDRGPSQTMIDLTWDHKVNLIGKKVVNPMIHNCDKCKKPILIYGRMIPCKHVFCLSCATQSLTPGATSTCPRCSDKVVRVEQAGLGSIYMCSHGGSRYGSNGCRRTYLSQRDLQAHIQHRHIKQQQQQAALAASPSVATGQVLQNTHNSSNTMLAAAASQLPSAQEIAAATAAIVANRKRQEHQQHPSQQAAVATGVVIAPQHSHVSTSGYQQQFSHPPPHQGPAANSYHYTTTGQQVKHQQSNLITVPIQDNTASPSGGASSVGTYGVASQSGQWAQAPSTAPGYLAPTAPSYYHTGSNNSGSNSTSSVIGGYNATHGVGAPGHSHHSSHHQQQHHQGGVTGTMLMGANAQWTQQSNNRTSGVDRTASGVEHVRGSGERTSGGYRR